MDPGQGERQEHKTALCACYSLYSLCPQNCIEGQVTKNSPLFTKLRVHPGREQKMLARVHPGREPKILAKVREDSKICVKRLPGCEGKGLLLAISRFPKCSSTSLNLWKKAIQENNGVENAERCRALERGGRPPFIPVCETVTTARGCPKAVEYPLMVLANIIVCKLVWMHLPKDLVGPSQSNPERDWNWPLVPGMPKSEKSASWRLRKGYKESARVFSGSC